MLPLLFFDELPNKLLLIDLIFHLSGILNTLFLHHEDRLMVAVFDELIFDVLIHHVEPILDVVFRSARHLFDDLRPLVADGESLLKDKNIFAYTEWILFDLGIQEIHPSFSALLAVSRDAKTSIELVSNLRPLLGAILSYELHKLLIFPLDPVTLLDRRLLVLVELVLALRIISSGDEPSDLDPVILVEFLWSDALPSAVLLDRPLKQVGFVICPVFFGVVSFFTL